MKLFKKTLLATALVGASVAAQAELSANVGVTTEYFWRGVSQSAGSPSVSGGFDYAADSGFYAGTWAGTIDDDAGTIEVEGELVDVNAFDGAEVDFYAGFGGDSGYMTYDVGYIYYYYPSVDDIDFGEIYGSAGFGPLSIFAAYTVNSDGDDNTDLFVEGDLFYSASLSGDISENLSGGLTVGRYDFDNGFGLADYDYFQVDLTQSSDLGDFTLSFIDNDISGSDSTVVFSWGLGI